MQYKWQIIISIQVNLCIFFALSAFSQSAQLINSGNNVKFPTEETMILVAARIAATYHADPATVEAFVRAAVKMESRIGIAAPVVIAIAINESGFNSFLFQNSGNPFGIKASSPWSGDTFAKWHDDTITKFRVYHSPEEAILDFGQFVNSRSWYADALACPSTDYTCIVDGLKKTDTQLGYSMNMNWDEVVLGIIGKVGLEVLSK
jgi:flagellum-specific peptidoglycan hydrolase FlgJ